MSKLAIGGAATAATASVSVPAYYLINQQMESSKSNQLIPKDSAHRDQLFPERRRKINLLVKGNTKSPEAESVDNFLKNHPGCEVYIRKDGGIPKPFYEYSYHELLGFGDRFNNDLKESKALCEKGIDPIFVGQSGSGIYLFENEHLAK